LITAFNTQVKETDNFGIYRCRQGLKELNQATPHFMFQELDRNQCIHGCPQKFFQEGVADPWG